MRVVSLIEIPGVESWPETLVRELLEAERVYNASIPNFQLDCLHSLILYGLRNGATRGNELLELINPLETYHPEDMERWEDYLAIYAEYAGEEPDDERIKHIKSMTREIWAGLTHRN